MGAGIFSGPSRVTEVKTTDEQLMRDLAAGREEAVGTLYARYAPIVFGMARQAVDPATAEEIVQDVFLALWRNASSYESERGTVRPWLLQIAHYRIANELRRRSRRPRVENDGEGDRFARLADPSPNQAEEAWQGHRREILRRALEELPPPQRQALGLAYFEDLSHGEIASVLGIPLGTAKSRIRAGVESLRGKLGPIAAALALLLLSAGLAVRFAARNAQLARDERALAMLTSSDSQSLRLTAVPGTPGETHATYRFRSGSPIAVLTLSNFRPAAQGQTYRAWARQAGQWTLLGSAAPDQAGRAQIVAEGPRLAARPDELEVTAEGGTAGAAPNGSVVVRWPADRE